ncbi:MAG TPA: dTDP-4-dehydrorhamnose 3,5-epimerase family protein, partial [candidate division Zixibacteria bacterium]|nr:dTDP-4-dehydrorhamnose 3,5-epimerase family protein [candidate division Zixibacteria bacterium]
MKVIQTALSGVIVIEPKLFHDNRGFFLETYREEAYRKIGIDVRFVQDNHSLSKAKETVRGMHYQIEPKAQSKLV